MALFVRDGAEEAAVGDELEQARRQALEAEEAGDEDTVTEITDEWSSRVLELFAERPDAVREVRELVGEALTRRRPPRLPWLFSTTSTTQLCSGRWTVTGAPAGRPGP
ncbi:hypothetical protein F3K37_42010 [Streptomyces sp. LBUM 1477]|nr:hypothetical protein [Streptomyces sp. LBUM 1477]MBP5880684.1 hypothetical protein [Streptomyces sp. LBUM 1477]